jgi:L-iditol 2-dehydrogenase
MLTIPAHVSYQDAALAEPLACVMRGLEETGVQPGDIVAVIGLGPIGLMFVRLAKTVYRARVIAIGRRQVQLDRAICMGAGETVLNDDGADPVARVRELTGGRGADVVIEAVGRPEAWVLATEMVRKGGTVNFFGGCAKGTKVELDTNRLHYSEITLKATFHHTPETVRRAFGLIAAKKIRPTDYITGEAPLSSLQKVLRHMLNRGGDIKTAIIPGH